MRSSFCRTNVPFALAAALACLAGAAQAQTVIACPERMKTLAVTLADPAQIKGFTGILGGEGSSQTWLQDVAVYADSAVDAAPVQGVASGKKKIDWTFDGQSDVTVACVYEGGVKLVRAVGKPRGCTATILRSKDPGAEGWGMDNAKFTCR